MNPVVNDEGRADGRTTRWAGQRDRRRTEIVEAAITVIERSGPGAHVAEIAAEAGVGRAVLYRHFEDRADLDRAVADRAADLLVADLAPRLVLSGGDVDGSIAAAIEAFLDFIQAHPHLYRFARAHDAGTGVGPVSRVKATVAARVAEVARTDLPGATGAVPAAIDVLAAGVVGLADAAVGRWLEEPGSLDRSVLTRSLAAMVRGAGEAVLGPLLPAR